MGKKILFISELVGLGGGETSLLNIIQELNLRGFDITVVVPNQGKLVDLLIKENIKVDIIEALFLTRRNKYKFPFVFLNILKYIYYGNFDIVHSNALKSSYFFGIISKILRKKFYYTCHGQWIKFSRLKRYILQRLCKKIVAVSNNVKDNLLKQGFSTEKVQQIYLGIDIEKYTLSKTIDLKTELGIDKDTILIGIIARFQKIKGQDIFVKSAKDFIQEQEVSGRKVCFILVGDNTFGDPMDAEFKQGIFDFVNNHKMTEKVVFLGERTDIPEILKSLDLLIVPSRNESFGMVIIEAMASGCPVIASNCDGPSEIIIENETGLLFEVGNTKQLTRNMINIFENKLLYESIKKKAFSFVNEKFSIKIVASAYIYMYESEGKK
ncbi:glycosyltransferase family 4 protein [Neobacillus drentensis]|uniref:glycosyltransferase family 4 protein n=1 Tax=Neobacillus drentensis TaxID=220684 RepID=UPI0030036784